MTADEENLVNNQIRLAEKVADQQVPSTVNEWGKRDWNFAFEEVMDDLCVKAGVRVRLR